MNNYKILLFDLDGTISDPKEGITKSVQYALEKMNIFKADATKLEGFIGPPLQESFARYYGFDEEKTQRAIDLYRERFTDKGMFENELYPKITLLLERLQTQYTLVIATSKPTVFAERILQYFKIDSYFELIAGSNLNGTRTSKTDVIKYILGRYKECKPEEFVMIGDREHDILGAKNTGIDSIGVTYGYGSPEELRQSEPTYIVHNVNELLNMLIRHDSVGTL
ncbi:HAD family hydrolase [Oceanobacillus massiliensis]|uniref:HAD family hydrolase n=1 Tax=Oceanobacillus massiliensis TaxID=1465765 RepID=UPI000288E1C5|nr:HAD family hydrolase [Oceanobacillus massiliensis]